MPGLTLGVHSMQLILINAVDLRRWHHRLNQAHDPLAHVAIQRIVRRERNNAVLLQPLLDLKIRLAHFHKRLGVITAGDHTAIVIAEHHDGDFGQIRPEHPLATGIIETMVQNPQPSSPS